MMRMLAAIGLYALAAWAAYLLGLLLTEALATAVFNGTDEGLVWTILWKWGLGLPYLGFAVGMGGLALAGFRLARRMGASVRVRNGIGAAIGGGLPLVLYALLRRDLLVSIFPFAMSAAAGVAVILLLTRWLEPPPLHLAHDALGLQDRPSET